MNQSKARARVGVDENGLGSRLGPMLVTGVLAEVRGSDAAVERACASARIGDSKALCAHGSMREVEASVLALAEVHLGAGPSTFRDLLERLSLHDGAWLSAPCPHAEASRQCLGGIVNLPAFGGTVTPAHRDAAQTLLDSGVRVRAVRAVSTCARRLNAARALGRNRFDVDLDAMIALIKELWSIAGRDVSAVCGKVGGRRRYDDALSGSFALVGAETNTAARADYVIPSVGAISFVQDADASDPFVSLASLFGKYLRELSMERIYRFYAQAHEGLARASGYHDPVTAGFVATTEVTRKRLAIPDDCFFR